MTPADKLEALEAEIRGFSGRYATTPSNHDAGDWAGRLSAIRADLGEAVPDEGALVARFKTACRALIRERIVYGEDVETLGDVLRALESLAANPPSAGSYEWFDPYAGLWKPVNRLPYEWERELGIPWRSATSTPPATVPVKALREVVPTNWCDSLLTSTDGLGKPPWDCFDIERLLTGIRDRIEALIAAQEKK